MDHDWVPRALKDANRLPESTGTFGSPWLLASGQGSFRHGYNDIPFFGFGHFLHGLTGTLFVCAWPVSVLRDLAVAADNGLGTFAAVRKESFKATVEKKCFHTLLRHGQTIWIPAGWCEVQIALQDTDMSLAVLIPYMTTTFVSELPPDERDLMTSGFRMWSRKASVKDAKPWKTFCPAFMTWVKGAVRGPDDENAGGEDTSDEEGVHAVARDVGDAMAD